MHTYMHAHDTHAHVRTHIGTCRCIAQKEI